MSVKNAFYAQSGGVTSVINASACGIIQTANKHKDKIGSVYAGQNGIVGALTENLIDTQLESDEDIAALLHTPSGAFGSCRYKLKSLEENKAEYDRLIEVFKAHNIGYFFYNGGGDSADTCLKVSQLSEKMGYPIQAIHVPKTIDNDLPVTDNCPGFGSVAKYIAVSTREASFDVASMAETSTKVFVFEVMGRHAGWIAAAGALAADEDNDIPVIVLFPEIKFDQDKFVALVHAQLGGAAPVVSNIIKEQLGYKFHWAVADYLQRSARHLASQTDLDQAYALGEAAVNLALEGKNSVMPAVIRTSNDPYQWEIQSGDLSDIANVEKMMPMEYISEDGFGITEACREYLLPLIAGEAYPPYKNGLPNYVTLKKNLVEKKLTEFKVK